VLTQSIASCDGRGCGFGPMLCSAAVVFWFVPSMVCSCKVSVCVHWRGSESFVCWVLVDQMRWHKF
jgi:hypothetical protein